MQLNQYKLQSEIGKVGLGAGQEQWELVWGICGGSLSRSSAWQNPLSSSGNVRLGQEGPSLEVRKVLSSIGNTWGGGWAMTPDS